MIDLRGVIASLGGTALIVDRRPPGIYSQGIYIPPTPVAVALGRCSVQPGIERGVVLPEGVRAEDTVTVYSAAQVRGAADPEGYQADRFTHRGRRFEVFDVRDWDAGGAGLYFKASCKRVREDEADEA